MSKINYSIIIPHKNTPHLLQKCIDSIPSRDDIQIIIVDDNSVDQFQGYCREEVEIVYLKKSSGAGFARNIGLQKAKGKWLLFADSDDYYLTDAFQILDNYKDSNFEVVFFDVKIEGGRRLNTNKIIQSFNHKNKKSEIYLRYKNNVVWNKMIRKLFIDSYNIDFEECNVNNDVRFTLMIGLCMEKFIIEQSKLYCCTYRDSSMSYVKRDLEREFEYFKMSMKRNGFYKSIGESQLSRSLVLYISYIIYRRGLFSALKYFMYCFKNRNQLKESYNEYSLKFKMYLKNNKKG
ncbi:MAG: glycosyltransferase [Bacteroidales bacterium]|jgi:glycosyltransferase involved in cell wall biosynthesis|nr:glycosyltransferase [Bacteroidales bacterium]